MQLKTNRSPGKFLLLSIVTCGIYAIVFSASIAKDLNRIASPHDGKKTMSYYLVCFVLDPLTFFIAEFVWNHRLASRIGCELRRRGISYSFGAGSFWGWLVCGVYILVGPFVYISKLCTAMNLLCEDYNKGYQ